MLIIHFYSKQKITILNASDKYFQVVKPESKKCEESLAMPSVL